MIDLKERRQRLAKALRILSPTPTIVSMSDWNPTSGTLTITAGTRLMKTDKRFTCRETFVNPRDPWLESFQYAVEGPPSEIAETALFRYECHPNIDNPTHYKCVPHFHPKEVCADPELLALH